MLDEIIFLDIQWFNAYNTKIMKDAKILKDIYDKKHWKIDISQGTFAILHELGHIITADTYKNLSLRFSNYRKKVEYIMNNVSDRAEGLKQYRNLTLENDADKMAYKVYQLHKEKIDEFDKQIIQLLQDTYGTA